MKTSNPVLARLGQAAERERAQSWTREDAVRELVRGRLELPARFSAAILAGPGAGDSVKRRNHAERPGERRRGVRGGGDREGGPAQAHDRGARQRQQVREWLKMVRCRAGRARDQGGAAAHPRPAV